MGNFGSSGVTIEKDGDNFIQTTEGVQLSTSLVERLSTGKSHSQNSHVDQRVDHEAANALKQYQTILEEREKQLSDLQLKWKNDLEQEKEKHKKFCDQSFEEFQRSAHETESKFKRPTLKPICEVLQKQLIDCYQNNSDHVLDCSPILKDFSLCVNKANSSLFTGNSPDGA